MWTNMYVISSEITVTRYRHCTVSQRDSRVDTKLGTYKSLHFACSAVWPKHWTVLRQCDCCIAMTHRPRCLLLVCMSLVMWKCHIKYIHYSRCFVCLLKIQAETEHTKHYKCLDCNMLSWYRQSSAPSWRINTMAWRLPFCFIVRITCIIKSYKSTFQILTRLGKSDIPVSSLFKSDQGS